MSRHRCILRCISKIYEKIMKNRSDRFLKIKMNLYIYQIKKGLFDKIGNVRNNRINKGLVRRRSSFQFDDCKRHCTCKHAVLHCFTIVLLEYFCCGVVELKTLR